MSQLAFLQRLFREIFEDDTLAITPETSHADIEGWDSIAQVKLVLAVESELGIRFESTEISAIQSVGDLMRAIEKHS